MREIHLSEMPEAYSAETLCGAFQRTVAARGDDVALRTLGDRTRITWTEYGDRVRRYAAGLAGLGVGPGDAVALMVVNRPEFNLLDAAAMHLGAVPFSMYNTSPAEQVAYLLADSRARVVATEPAFLDLVREGARGSSVEHIVLVEGDAEGTLDLDALERAAPDGFDFDARWRAVGPDAALTIIYTSGTTGPSKGVEITHANMMAQLRCLYAARGETLDPSGRTVSYLPHAHIADRVAAHYTPMALGICVTACPHPTQVFAHIADAAPTAISGVPRVFEKLKAALEARFAAAPPEQQAAIRGALDASLRKVRLEQARQPVPEPLREACERADQAIFAPLRKSLGFEHTRDYFVGAAPTPREVLEFFHAIGIPLSEVWGMSELSCLATAMPPGDNRIGKVGVALPGVELRLADDGEILVRGAIVMRGYRNKPEQTREALDADGWLHTGDIGTLDADGFLAIVDRKKELIINAGGKNMSPANIEARVKTSSPLIGQACVIGNGRPYNVALVVLEPEAAAAFARARDLPTDPGALAGTAEVHAAIEQAMTEANSHLSRVEQIKRFAVLGDEWLPGGDELTPTMKLRRKPIERKYAARIEALYR